jgi:transcriptional regulator with XRE-family HTH domain
MKATKTELTHWMREQRIQHGLRQLDAAALFRISLPTYRRWEQGQMVPTIQHQRLMQLEYAELDRTKQENGR